MKRPFSWLIRTLVTGNPYRLAMANLAYRTFQRKVNDISQPWLVNRSYTAPWWYLLGWGIKYRFTHWRGDTNPPAPKLEETYDVTCKEELDSSIPGGGINWTYLKPKQKVGE